MHFRTAVAWQSGRNSGGPRDSNFITSIAIIGRAGGGGGASKQKEERAQPAEKR